METKELGAGSYPAYEEKSEFKCYEFEVNISLVGNGYVYAKSEEEAIRLINLGSWEELEKFKIERVEDIVEIKEVNK